MADGSTSAGRCREQPHAATPILLPAWLTPDEQRWVGPGGRRSVTKIHEIKNRDPALFRAYAARDAEIVVEGFTYLREVLLCQWGIDPLHHSTPASVGGEIFRRHFFRSAMAPYRTERELAQRRRRDGEWTSAHRTFRTYAGDLVVRHLAIRAIHGGRNEAFVRGYYPRPVLERDVRSMYPSVARSMGLPDLATKWVPAEATASIEAMEGFGHVRFRFPPDTRRPCLPVRLSSDTLLFPLEGESHATFAEFRLALRMGAEIEIFSARGYTPGPRERSHDLHRYLGALQAEKDRAAPGSLHRQFYKDLLNQPLGKLGQKSRDLDFLMLERYGREEGVSGLGALVGRTCGPRVGLQTVPSVGSLWSPEQLALILGAARAVIGEIVATSNALSVSTDAVIIDAESSVECAALERLRAVGSEMPIEVSGDGLFIGRSRQYAILAKRSDVQSGTILLAGDETFGVLKVARHGSVESAEQFASTVLACLAAGQDVAPIRALETLVSPEAAARDGRQIGERTAVERRTNFAWDKKRALVDRDASIFRSFTETRPYQSRARREGAEQASKVKSGQARRRRKPVSESKRQEVLQALASGPGVREVARLLGLPTSTVYSIQKRGCPSKSDLPG